MDNSEPFTIHKFQEGGFALRCFVLNQICHALDTRLKLFSLFNALAVLSWLEGNLGNIESYEVMTFEIA